MYLVSLAVNMVRLLQHNITAVPVYLTVHTYRHTPVLRPFFRDYPGEPDQKGKTNMDFTEAKARDSEWQWHQLGHMQVCISCQHPTTQFFALPATQPTASKH